MADGGFSQRGRVEQCINGVWGTFCDSGWDNTDVVTLCRSMGYPGNSKSPYSWPDSHYCIVIGVSIFIPVHLCIECYCVRVYSSPVCIDSIFAACDCLAQMTYF